MVTFEQLCIIQFTVRRTSNAWRRVSESRKSSNGLCVHCLFGKYHQLWANWCHLPMLFQLYKLYIQHQIRCKYSHEQNVRILSTDRALLDGNLLRPDPAGMSILRNIF